jgi:hypothetical protein
MDNRNLQERLAEARAKRQRAEDEQRKAAVIQLVASMPGIDFLGFQERPTGLALINTELLAQIPTYIQPGIHQPSTDAEISVWIANILKTRHFTGHFLMNMSGKAPDFRFHYETWLKVNLHDTFEWLLPICERTRDFRILSLDQSKQIEFGFFHEGYGAYLNQYVKQ